jgi:uncharacterized protein
MDAYTEISGGSFIETPMFFANGHYRLFGILHQPTIKPSGWGWVFCHPFGEEKLWAQRVYVSFARMLAAQGAYVLRFDAMGSGDSDGQFFESSVESTLADIAIAIETLKRSSDTVVKVGLLGLRFGATLAALTAEQHPDISKVVLWEPIIDGAKYMHELLRVNLMTQTAVYKEIRHNRDDLIRLMREGHTVNVDGYEVAYPYFVQASAINLNQETKRSAGPWLIVQIGKAGAPLRPDLEALQASHAFANLREAAEEPFWKEIRQWYRAAPNLFETTLAWIRENNVDE